MSPVLPNVKSSTKFKFAGVIIFQVVVETSYLNPKLISANAKLTISVSNAAGIFDTNFGIILEAIELLGITLLNVQ